jgi:hypothetical protein
MPSFAIPWILTWFSHSIKKINIINRIFDYLLCSPPHTIIFTCAAVFEMYYKLVDFIIGKTIKRALRRSWI